MRETNSLSHVFRLTVIRLRLWSGTKILSFSISTGNELNGKIMCWPSQSSVIQIKDIICAKLKMQRENCHPPLYSSEFKVSQKIIKTLRSKKAGRFEKLLGFARSHSIVTRGSVNLSCANTWHPSCFSKS